jgi:putative endonuclease
MVLCADDTYYTGSTSDLEERILVHNGKGVGGARYTRARRPVTLVYYENSSSRGEALKREYALKQLTRDEKISLIASSRNELYLQS